MDGWLTGGGGGTRRKSRRLEEDQEDKEEKWQEEIRIQYSSIDQFRPFMNWVSGGGGVDN